MLKETFSMRMGRIFKIENGFMYIRCHDGFEMKVPFSPNFCVGEKIYVVVENNDIIIKKDGKAH